MEKKVKKPVVEPDKRQNWLKRYEEGESPPQIAEADHFDVRTVRAHIQKAKQEREIKDARALVLRNALEQHYRDLCEYAEKLDLLAHGESAAMSLREECLHSALRQHLPRSPIWNYLKQRAAINEQISMLRKQADTKLEEIAASDSQLNSQPHIRETALPAMVDVLKSQFDKWVRGVPGLTKDRLFEQNSGELINLHYGPFHLGNYKKEDIPLVRKIVADLEPRIRELEEYGKLESLYSELNRIESNLKEALAVITLRRVVPGRCRYCPL